MIYANTVGVYQEYFAMEQIKRILDINPALARKSVFLFGPRQSGKTTYINKELNGKFALFWTLLDGRLRIRVQADPSLLRQEVETRNLHDCAVCIDEIQKCPELLEEVHLLIEERNIRFLLTGSSARKLRHGGVNLLGGRALQYYMHPFCYREIMDIPGIPFTLERAFRNGLIPSMYLSDFPDEDLGAYIDTYLTEEIAAEGAARNLPGFSRFLEFAAKTNAQILNFTNIANDARLPRQTVKLWYDVLVDTLLGYEVLPFTATKKRKAIETPKFYFFDTGIVRALCGIDEIRESNREFGDFFEQFICMELRAWLDYTGSRQQLCYWRSTSDYEVDFTIGTELAIEVKSTQDVQERHLRGLKALREENIFQRYIVVCREEHPRTVEGIEILPWQYFLEQLKYGK